MGVVFRSCYNSATNQGNMEQNSSSDIDDYYMCGGIHMKKKRVPLEDDIESRLVTHMAPPLFRHAKCSNSQKSHQSL